jgi:hypothetical protein
LIAYRSIQSWPALHLPARAYGTQHCERRLCSHRPRFEHPCQDRQALIAIGQLFQPGCTKITSDPRKQHVASGRLGIDPHSAQQYIEQSHGQRPADFTDLRQIDDARWPAFEYTPLKSQYRLRRDYARDAGQAMRAAPASVWREIRRIRQSGQAQLYPALGTGSHQHRAMCWTGCQPANRPRPPYIRHFIFGETIRTDAYPSRLMRRPFGRETLPTEPVRHRINNSVIIRPVGEAQRSDAVAQYACAARERRNDERIGFAPPVGIGCETHLTVAEQQGFRRDTERFGEPEQPGRQRFVRQRCNPRRQRSRRALRRIEELNLVTLSRRHVGAPWEE